MKAKNWFIDAAKGAALGTGILPGVSVGTVGIIVDVYDKLIESIAGLRRKFGRSFLMLLPIALGCLVSAVALLIFWKKIVYPYAPFPIICALAGFVIAGTSIIIQEIKKEPLKKTDFILAGVGFVLAAAIGLLSFLSAAGVININLNFVPAFDSPFDAPWIYAVVVAVGFVAAVACLIPGISGSMVLFIFGLYNPVVGLFLSDRDSNGNIIHSSIFHNVNNKPVFWGQFILIVALLVGILLGFLITSSAMKKLLEKKRHATFVVVFGFVIGSLVSMFLNNDMYVVYTNNATNQWWQFLIGGVALVAVLLVTLFLLKRRKNKVN